MVERPNGIALLLCLHQERYAIKDPCLLYYLTKQCEGFVEDPEGKYTLQYLLHVLLANWRERNLLKDCDLRVDKHLRIVFRTRDLVIPLYKLRFLIFKKLESEVAFTYVALNQEKLKPPYCNELKQDFILLNSFPSEHHCTYGQVCEDSNKICNYLEIQLESGFTRYLRVSCVQLLLGPLLAQNISIF